MQNISYWLDLAFIVVTGISLAFFFKATQNSLNVLLVLLAWLILQSVLGLSGFYLNTQVIPPRFSFLLLPTLVLMAVLFSTTSGKKFLDSLQPDWLILLHVVRIPVELVLFFLFTYHAVPELMTFEGRNFDILSGITAPLIWYFGVKKKVISQKIILWWNIVCLGLLFNIVGNAILAAPSPFQMQAFDQPNVAVLYFPYLWLPCLVVPMVLFSHLAMIRRLTRQ